MKESNKSVIFLCVNYNTNELLDSYLESITKAVSVVNRPLKVDVLVGDNSESFEPVKQKQNNDISIFHIKNKDNLGYIGGITNAIEESGIDLTLYDYVIISNVDLTISEGFLNKLVDLEIASEIGWIAPCIFSEKEQRDRNPQRIKRPSVNRMRMLSLMFRFPVLHFIYSNLIYKNRDKKSSLPIIDNIYAGHGSFIILTNSFVKKNPGFSFPGFLFGEEIFFAELVRLAQLKTVYIPELIVNDIEHASTSRLKRAAYYKMNYHSINMLMEKFFL